MTTPVEVCKELNVDISSHIAHRLRGKDLIRGNFFVVMEPVHRQILVEAGVDPDQVYVLGGPEGIPDPYKKDAEEFRKVRDQIIASFADLDNVLIYTSKTGVEKISMNADIQMVPMQEKHIPALAQLERLCFSQPWTESGLRSELHNKLAVFCVAEQNGQVLGYAGMQCVMGECYINNIAVFHSLEVWGLVPGWYKC